MTPLWRLVATREVTTRLREKAYLVSTGILLLIVVGGIVASSLLGGGAPSYDVAVTSGDGAQLARAAQHELQVQSADEGAALHVRRVDDVAAARTLLRDDEVDVALTTGPDGAVLLGRSDVPTDLAAAVRAAQAQRVLEQNARRHGTTADQLLAGSAVTERAVQPDDVDRGAADATAFVMTLLFFVSSIGFGTAIAQSVVQEKENRIVEILAAAVPLRALLWGKVVGNSLLALGQVVLVSAAALLARVATGQTGGLPDLGVSAAWFLAFFVVGFLALASLWSVAGSLATRQEDLQATTAPGQALLFVPYLVAVTGSAKAITVMSWIPIASSMTMPGRVAHGGVPVWQPALSLALAVLAAVLLVRLGARWYERTLLQTSRRTRYRELLRGRDL